jgi:hypothetical protein
VTLSPIDLFNYCLGKIPTPSDPRELLYWKQADMAIQGVLLTNMELEIIVQIDSGITVAQFWVEIKYFMLGNHQLTLPLYFRIYSILDAPRSKTL